MLRCSKSLPYIACSLKFPPPPLQNHHRTTTDFHFIYFLPYPTFTRQLPRQTIFGLRYSLKYSLTYPDRRNGPLSQHLDIPFLCTLEVRSSSAPSPAIKYLLSWDNYISGSSGFHSFSTSLLILTAMVCLRTLFVLLPVLSGRVYAAIGPTAVLQIGNNIVAPDGFSRT